MTKKIKVIFVCTKNSARSQMAEGLLRHLYGDRYEVYSAGTEPAAVNPLAIKVMHEMGIDISHHRSKGIGEFAGIDFDVVATVCDRARMTCPITPLAGMAIHKSFEDPTDLPSFRKTCREIRDWIETRFNDPDTMKATPFGI